MNAIVVRLLNVGLRGLALFSRFVLLFFLAKFLDPLHVGVFGLLLASIAFGVLLIGGDFYTFSHRALLQESKQKWAFVIQHHLLAMVLLYAVFLPLLLLLFWFDLLPSRWLSWFFVLLVVEHIGQELNRFLVVMQRQLMASWVLLLRMGAWIWPLLLVMWFWPETRLLETVLWYWLWGGLLAIGLGVLVLVREVGCWRFFAIDFRWLRQGLKVGALFLLATLSLKVLLTVDRFVIEQLVGGELLSVYVLYMGMAMAVFHFLDPAIFSFLYPRLVVAGQQKQFVTYTKIYRELFLSTLLLSVLLAVGLVVLAPEVLAWIGRELYFLHIELLWLLVVVVLVYALSMVPHYGLYALGGDRFIMQAHLISLLVFSVTVFLLAAVRPFEAVAWGLLSGFTAMALFKEWRYRLLFRATLAAEIS